VPVKTVRPFQLHLVVMLAVLTAAHSVSAQQAPPAGVIAGAVSTQDGSVRLPGAVVTVTSEAGVQVDQKVADGEGRFRTSPLAPGSYHVAAMLAGFESTQATVAVTAGGTSTVTLDLPIAQVSESVEVVAAPAEVGMRAETIAPTERINGSESDRFTPGGGVAGALRLLASVVQLPSGLSIKGGRPNQAGAQVGVGTLIDPSTGVVDLTLPADAVDSVTVLPNPYAVEFGRFSSGLVVIQTRQGTNRWHFRLNDIDPNFRVDRSNNLKPIGLMEFAPRVEVSGPLSKDKLFIEQAAQYRYYATDVPSLPQDLLKVTRWGSTFTRLDLTASSRHSLVASGGAYWSSAEDATLGTFTPPDATVNLHERIGHVTFAERALWSNSLVSESTLRIQRYQIDADPQSPLPMVLRPDTTFGSFFNTQTRSTSTIQWVETVSATHDGIGGQHLVKVGLDLLRSTYDGTSASSPVLIESPDGVLVRRLDFSGPTAQRARGTDLALFAQDRVQPSSRWYVEFGGRLDHDGVLDQMNLTPRAGAALLLNASGTAVVRGGYGLFYERTPSVVSTFTQFEAATDTRFAADGLTPLAPPQQFVHVVAPNLQAARSRTWNVSFDQRFNSSWALHAGFLTRQGANGLLVEPIESADGAQLLLDSNGHSTYREAEIGVHFTHQPGVDLNASYVRSVSSGDLNSFTDFFGAVMSPVIGANAYGPTAADVPHRLLVRGRIMPTPRWLVLGTADWRSGLPYSIVNEALDFIGPRNVARFPTAVRLQIGVERRTRILKWDPWIGVRVDNPTNAFLPADVQNNISSPAFGSFYNSPYRRLRIIVQFGG
jgi:hypothetical protein